MSSVISVLIVQVITFVCHNCCIESELLSFLLRYQQLGFVLKTRR